MRRRQHKAVDDSDIELVVSEPAVTATLLSPPAVVAGDEPEKQQDCQPSRPIAKLVGDWDVVKVPAPAPPTAPAPPATAPLPLPGVACQSLQETAAAGAVTAPAALATTVGEQQSRGETTSPARRGRSGGLMVPVLRGFEAAVEGQLDPATGLAEDLFQAPLLEGLEAYAGALDALGGSLGGYLLSNVKKIRQSKADWNLSSYRAFLQSELPVHGATGYKCYVDESAWMGNLWMSWTLEFFVELFAQLHSGLETRQSVDVAYKQTLYHHHNFFQRSAFSAAVRSLPPRAKILESLCGGDKVDTSDIVEDIGDFVVVGRAAAKFCMQLNEELDLRLQQERQRKR